MLILRAVVDQQQQAGRRQALDEAVEQRLGLGIDPVQVFEDQQQGLHLAFAQEHALEGLERALAALGWIEPQEGAVGRQGVQERQQRRDGLLERLVQRQRLPGDLGPDGARLVPVVHMAVALEQVDHGEIGRGFAVGHRGALQHAPALGAMGVDELVDQARLPHASLAHRGHHLAVPRPRPLQRLRQRLPTRSAARQSG